MKMFLRVIIIFFVLSFASIGHAADSNQARQQAAVIKEKDRKMYKKEGVTIPYSDPHLSTVLRGALETLTSAMTTKIDFSPEGNFRGELKALEKHPNQVDLSNMSFQGNYWAQTVKTLPGIEGKTLKIEGHLGMHTMEYAKAYQIRLGGEWVDRDAEIQFIVDWNSKISSTSDLLSYLSVGIKQDCIKEFAPEKLRIKRSGKTDLKIKNKDPLKAFKASLCNAFDSSKLQGSPSDKAYQMLITWKQTLIKQLAKQHEENPNLFVNPKCFDNKVKNKNELDCDNAYQNVVEVLTNKIRVTKGVSGTKLQLSIASINEELGPKFEDFFDTYKLDIIQMNQFEVVVGEDETTLSMNFLVNQPKTRIDFAVNHAFSVYNGGVKDSDSAERAGVAIGAGLMKFLLLKIPGLPTTRTQAGLSADAAWATVFVDGATSKTLEAGQKIVVDKVEEAISGLGIIRLFDDRE